MINYEIYEKCLIAIIRDAILNENNAEIPKEIDIELLGKIAEMHKISSILYPILEKKGIKNAKMRAEFNYWLTVETNQQVFLDILRERLEAEKIRFICIKGAYIRTLYPETYMRSSTDLDIFVDDENTERVREIMQDLGCEVIRFSHKLQDDAYAWGNFVHIEIHRRLINKTYLWSQKCQEIVGRTFPKKEGSYEYVMSAEDFYLHMIAHMAKHLKYSGCGIRMVLDVWIYLRRLGDTLDRDILNERLKDCGLDIFEREIVKLVDYWFCGKDADIKTKALARYIFGSGLFGSNKQYFATELATIAGNGGSVKSGTVKKLMKNIFTPYTDMAIYYPKLQKYPILLPYYWFVKNMRVLLFRRNRIKEVITSYDGIEVDDAKNIAEFKKSIGL